MIPIALIAAGLLAASAPADPRVETFAQACLSLTPMTRERLSELARQGRWEEGSFETPANLEWREVYRHGSAIIRLDQHRVTDDSPAQRICVVYVGQAPAGWRDQVSGLNANGSPVGAPGTYDTAVYQLPPGLELTVWDLPDGSRIHALREPDNSLELSVNYPTGR